MAAPLKSIEGVSIADAMADIGRRAKAAARTLALSPAAQRDKALGAMAQAIVNYFEDPALAHQHGRAGRNRVEENFSLDRMVDSYHELYLAQVRASRRIAESSLSKLPSAES